MEKISKRDMTVSIFFINIQLALMSIVDNALLLTITHGPWVFVDGRFLSGLSLIHITFFMYHREVSSLEL